MRFSSLLRTMREHWYLVLSGLVSTALLCFAAGSYIPPTYQVEASVLLVPAKSPVANNPNGENPLLGIGGLQPTADTLARAMTDAGLQDDLFAAGATGEYTVLLDPISKGPVLLVTVKDSSPTSALTTLNLLGREIPKVLAGLQDKLSVPSRAAVSTMVIAQDKQANLVLKDRIRLFGAIVGLGLGITFGLLVFLESRARQRSLPLTRRNKAEPEAKAPQPVNGNGTRSAPAVPERQPARVRVGPEDDETVRLKL